MKTEVEQEQTKLGDYSEAPRTFDVVLFHGNCADGFSAAWVARRYCLYNELKLPEFFPINHDGVYDLPKEIDSKSVLMLDLSFPHEKMLELKTRAASVFVIDHHLTAPERCATTDINLIYDVDECGASLTWKVYFPDSTLPCFLEYIRAGDLWKWGNLFHDKEIVTALHSYDNEFSHWDAFYNAATPADVTGFIKKYNAEGEALERKASKSVKDLLTRVVIMDMLGFKVPVTNSTEHISKLGNELALAYPDSPFAAVYSDDPAKGMRHWSLRSIGDKPENNVSTIAKAMGGGGHFHASGFTTPLPVENLRIEQSNIEH